MDTNKLASQVNKLNKLAAAGNDSARIQLDNAIDSLNKSNKAFVAQLVPNGHVKLYVSAQPDQSKLDYMTWNEYDPDGLYGPYDDNYCRPDPRSGVGNNGDNNGNNSSDSVHIVYPSRNISMGTVSLQSCDNIMSSDVKNITNISNDIEQLQLLAKHKLLTEEAGSAESMKATREKAEGKVEEYERATRQYLQLADMISNFEEVSKRHKAIITNVGEESYNKHNKVNILQDNMGEYIIDQKQINTLNDSIIFWMRIPLMLFWVIVVGLFLLKQI